MSPSARRPGQANTSEYEAPTRSEIKAELEAVRTHPANNGLSRAALRLKQRDRLDTFLQGRGMLPFEVEAILSDIESYYPQNYDPVGRQV